MAESARPPRRPMLAQYYQEDEAGVRGSQAGEASTSPMDINGPQFNADRYTQCLIKEASLSQLMGQEAEIHRQIGLLDSDMQTLVYENYNKFIAATDTIRKMRVDFRAMEDEMDQLAAKMQDITMFSGQISDTLRERRRKIGTLGGTHALLKKLQFLFELPSRLQACLAEDDWATGVKYYLRAQRVLEQYQHMASFQGIKADCDEIIVILRQRLLERVQDPETGSEALAECVGLLLALQESAEVLCDSYLGTAEVKLQGSLQVLEAQVKLASGEVKTDISRPSEAFESVMDILEFVDHGCQHFVSDLSLIIASFTETFLEGEKPEVDAQMANDKLTQFVKRLISVYFDHLRARFKVEKRLDEAAMRVRALDRFHRRLQAMCRLLSTVDFSKAGLDLVLEAADLHCAASLEDLKQSFHRSLMEARQSLVAPKRLEAESEADLGEINTVLLTSIAETIRTQMSHLQHYIDPELTFAVKTYFRAKFCRYFVREGVLIAFFSHIIEIAQNYCQDSEKNTPPTLLLLLSRNCFDLQLNTTHYLLTTVDEQFFIDDTTSLTSLSKVNDMLKHVSQMLLNHFVKLQGGVLSQMLRKSVETRDWLNSVEPRTVRAVMKRVVEETTMIDRQVGRLYEEGDRKARSSDSSRRTRLSQPRSRVVGGGAGGRSGQSWSITANSQLDTSLASNIQKMFNERIEIFAPVEFSKVSILTGIVKIALKTLLECVRLRTFSRFGFQQIQVDCQYLQLYLWRFVSDENLVRFLLDEILTSVVHRCSDPTPMDHSVVDVICDRARFLLLLLLVVLPQIEVELGNAENSLLVGPAAHLVPLSPLLVGGLVDGFQPQGDVGIGLVVDLDISDDFVDLTVGHRRTQALNVEGQSLVSGTETDLGVVRILALARIIPHRGRHGLKAVLALEAALNGGLEGQ
eukprot:snap_masked-scaffold19_size710362-processed-gene-0.6 protein:Tk00391 transcript:snap_masked-scaffold19_size710362-processed-gene-0.6-mRNA-1 annotation:"vacuolar protein sorting-associated protein 51 homolog"